MSDETKTAIANQNGEPTDLVIGNGMMQMAQVDSEKLNSDLERLEKLESVELKGRRSANVKYWEAEKGDEIRAIFLGWKRLEKPDEGTGEIIGLPAVILRTKTGDFINASTIIVESLMGIAQGAGLHIKCTGKKGRMKTFDITLLD